MVGIDQVRCVAGDQLAAHRPIGEPHDAGPKLGLPRAVFLVKLIFDEGTELRIEMTPFVFRVPRREMKKNILAKVFRIDEPEFRLGHVRFDHPQPPTLDPKRFRLVVAAAKSIGFFEVQIAMRWKVRTGKAEMTNLDRGRVTSLSTHGETDAISPRSLKGSSV